MEHSHGVILPQMQGVDVGRRGSNIYVVSLSMNLNLVECLVPGCPEKGHITVRM